MKEFTLTKRNDISPKCPHCEEELGEVFYQTKGRGLLEGRNAIYYCPSCHKVLGVGQGVAKGMR